MLKSQRLYHFGDFSLELDPPTLRRGLEVIKLPHRQMEILCLLIAAGGNPVAKRVFFEKIWPDSFVEEGNLTQTVFLLRRTLGKLPDGGEYIETLPRMGYRLAPAAGLSRHTDRDGRKPTITVQTKAVPLDADPPPPSSTEKPAPQTMRDRLSAKLETRWEPVFWIGVGVLVSLFVFLVALISLAYANANGIVRAGIRSSVAPQVISSSKSPHNTTRLAP